MTRKRSCAGFVTALLALLVFSGSAEAKERDKTDIIHLKNGDRVTGTILSLQYGELQLDTSSMGTVTLKWEWVTTIDSVYSFDVEIIGATHYYGRIVPSEDGKHIVVETDDGRIELEPSRISRIAEFDQGFWKRIHGSFSVGYAYTKSNDVSTGTLALNSTYRAERFVQNLTVSLQQTKSPDEGTQDRDLIAYGYQWLRPNRNYWFGLASLERNDELGIEARLEVAGGIGRYLVQTSFTEFSAFAGVGLSQEWVMGPEGAQQSLEALLGVSWHVFRLSTPKTSLTANGVLNPSLTESGRYRGSANVTLTKDIGADWTLNLSAYYDYDNDPPTSEASTDDYGVNWSLGYTF